MQSRMVEITLGDREEEDRTEEKRREQKRSLQSRLRVSSDQGRDDRRSMKSFLNPF